MVHPGALQKSPLAPLYERGKVLLPWLIAFAQSEGSSPLPYPLSPVGRGELVLKNARRYPRSGRYRPPPDKRLSALRSTPTESRQGFPTGAARLREYKLTGLLSVKFRPT